MLSAISLELVDRLPNLGMLPDFCLEHLQKGMGSGHLLRGFS